MGQLRLQGIANSRKLIAAPDDSGCAYSSRGGGSRPLRRSIAISPSGR
jgi:hypothetical protein